MTSRIYEGPVRWKEDRDEYFHWYHSHVRKPRDLGKMIKHLMPEEREKFYKKKELTEVEIMRIEAYLKGDEDYYRIDE